MPTNPNVSKNFRFNVSSAFGVDATSGNLTNLQLLAAGREAKGHGIYIDAKTLSTAKAAIDDRGGRLKAYVTHNHAGPSSWQSPEMDQASCELNIPGFFSSIAIKSDQLVAGAFEFFEAFKKNFAPQYEQLLEMAKKTPDLLGLSIEAWGYLVYVGKDGTEYSGEPDGVELLYNGMPAFRITDMWAAAFVSDGAATDGLFAQLSTKLGKMFGGKQDKTKRAEISAALLKFASEYALEDSGEPDSAALTATQEISSTMQIIAALKTKFTDPKRFAAAMSILGNTAPEKLSTLTLVEVEQGLTSLDLEVANAEVVRLNTALTSATSQVAALNTELATWKTKFETLKNSGKSGVLDLGAESSGTANEVNPWAKETKNLTQQCEMLKTNPTRAAALKAAAGVK